MQILWRTLGAGTLALIQGCTTVGVTNLDSVQAARPEGCELAFFFSEMEVGGPVVKTCQVSSNISILDPKVSRLQALENALSHLCECGSDGAILGTYGGTGFTYLLPVTGIAVPEGARGKSLAIVRQIMTCQDQGDQWVNNGCVKSKGTPFDNTSVGRRQRMQSGD